MHSFAGNDQHRFLLQRQKAWKYASPQFGLLLSSVVLSVLVKIGANITQDAPMPEAIRDGLATLNDFDNPSYSGE